MNILKLDEILDEHSVYFNCTKGVFLNKVDEVFSSFKELGDSELIYFTGKCGMTKCANFGDVGHCFVGNKSKYYINFVFGDTPCTCIKLNLKDLNLKLGYDIPFSVSYKEEAKYSNTFKKFPPFLELNRLMIKEVLLLERIEWWLMKYKGLFDKNVNEHFSIDVYKKPNDIEVFIELYKDLDYLTQVKRKAKQCELALQEYHNLMGSFQKKRKWVIKYETLGFDEVKSFYYRYFSDTDEDNEILISISYNEAEDICIDNREFKCLLEFFDVFEDLFWNEKVYTESANYNQIQTTHIGDIDDFLFGNQNTKDEE